jgi:DNA mismatch repair protein MutS
MTQPETAPPTPADPVDATSAATPMMAQYLAIKRRHPDCLLFYRMGDFYELFFDDAVTAARALDITLTRRGRHLGDDIPMCGVPVHSHETYLSRLIRQGFRVAVCEQTEDPADAKKRGAKSVVARGVVRVITPGTLTEDAFLDARRNNFLAALAEAQGAFGAAWLDMSTGEFSLQALGAGGLAAALARLDPGELVIPDRLVERQDLFEIFQPWRDRLTPLPPSRFDSVNGTRRLEALYGVSTLDAFGTFSRAELAAGGALVDYVELTQQGQLPRIAPPRRVDAGAIMEIDAATRRNLELVQTLTGVRKGSLLSVMDRTVTGAGARLLAAHLAAPLTDPAAIEDRLDAVQYFHDQSAVRAGLRDLLRRAPDMERALSRLGLGRGGPRDLAAIRDGLVLTAGLRAAVSGETPARIAAALADLGSHGDLMDRLAAALAGELPLLARDGGFIAPGYAAEFDELKSLRDQSRRLIAGLQEKYAAATGIAALKVRHNNVLGYFIEVSSRHADKMPVQPDGQFIHRQTMASALRYTTVELNDLEGRISSAADKALALEIGLFDELVAAVVAEGEAIARAAAALARLDAAAALAELAHDQRYCRPVMAVGSGFDIVMGRHPVVEAALAAQDGAAFVANDCRLEDADRLWLITGPNMAGKSTFLRQNALIAVMAQMGSFVPAERAALGVVDRLFSRVGAADDLARGRSTFMVEMVETAAILAQAGPRSLVILDEIGRGTATFDGLSIAWAVVEHLHAVNACRALFATHYHELTHLAGRLDAMSCHTMRVKEWKGEVVFLHEVAAGTADRSYGIHVGRLAGLPPGVVARAEDVLAALERDNQAGDITKLADDLPLFQAAAGKGGTGLAEAAGSEVEAVLAAADLDELSPREALDLLYRLKGMIGDD